MTKCCYPTVVWALATVIAGQTLAFGAIAQQPDPSDKITGIDKKLDAILTAREPTANERSSKSFTAPAAIGYTAQDLQLQKSLALKKLEDLQKLNVERDLTDVLRQSR